MSSSSVSCWDSVDQALERGDAKTAATTAQGGLRAAAYDERKNFLTQLYAVLLRRARNTASAGCVAEAGEQLWMMPEFRASSSSPSAVSSSSSVSGEALLLASALATAYMTLQTYEKVLVFDRELLQSPAFFSYDSFTAVDRLACVVRMLTASRCTGNTRYVESAVHKGMSLYHSLAKSSAWSSSPSVAQQQGQLNVVLCAYLFELAFYRQTQKDYLRAFQSFLVLYEISRQPEVLCRAAVSAMCIRTSEGMRQMALQEVLHHSSAVTMPSLYAHVQRAYNRELFRASDVAAVLETAKDFVPEKVLRDALREHNIVLLANTFDCVHWRSLCVHMDDDELTEGELYDLLVEMVRVQRLSVAIHQDTGFIEFGDGAETGQRHQAITDADVFTRIARAAVFIAAARPKLLS